MDALAHAAMVAVAKPNAPPSAKIFPAKSPPAAAHFASESRPNVTANHSAYINDGPKLPNAKTRRVFARLPRHMSTTVGIASAYVIVCMIAGNAGAAAARLLVRSNAGFTPGRRRRTPKRTRRRGPRWRRR